MNTMWPFFLLVHKILHSHKARWPCELTIRNCSIFCASKRSCWVYRYPRRVCHIMYNFEYLLFGNSGPIDACSIR